MKDVETICKFCGSVDSGGAKGYCQSCYKYFVLEKKTVYNVPGYGEIYYTEKGDVVCPICGMAYTKVMSHIYYKHGLTSREAFVKFGWHKHTTKATNEKYRKHMKEVQDPKTIEENLLVKGTDTRFEKGMTFNRDASHYKKVIQGIVSKTDKPVVLESAIGDVKYYEVSLEDLRNMFDSVGCDVELSEEKSEGDDV